MMTLRFLAVCAVLLAASLSVRADSPPYPLVLPGKAFDSMHANAIAANTPGISFVLRTIDGRSKYHCGERIQVQFVLASRVKNAFQYEEGEGQRDGWNKDDFVCDAATGAVDPYASAYLRGHIKLVGSRCAKSDQSDRRVPPANRRSQPRDGRKARKGYGPWAIEEPGE